MAQRMVRDRRLAAFLLAARERKNISGETAAGKLGWSPSKVSRVENYRTPVRAGDVGKMMDLYDVPARQQAIITDLVHQLLAAPPSKYGWDKTPPEDYGICRAVREWAPMVLPKFLQTPAYAEAVISSAGRIFRRPPGEVRALAALVTGPQHRLNRGGEMTLQAVIGEAALHRPFGGPAVMRDQLARVADLAGHPSVQVRILPLDAQDAPGDVPAFIHAQFTGIADAPVPDAVLLGQLDAGGEPLRLDDDALTYPHLLAFEDMWPAAVPAGDSERDLLGAVAARWA